MNINYDKKKYLKIRNIKAIVGTVIGTFIYCIAVVWIFDLGEFYAGGVTGIAQLISAIFSKINITIRVSIIIAFFNIPLFLIGWKAVSNRFAYLSLASVILQVVVIFLLELLVEAGFNPLISLANEKLLLSIIGGLLSGLGAGICLRYGSSTGGMDIFAQYISLKKKNVSFTIFSLIIDFIIIVFGAIVGGSINVAIFTIIRLLIHLIIIDKVHTIYKYMKITIVTTKKEEMRMALISNFNHGINIYKIIGGYSNQEKWVIESVVSRYEVEEYRNVAKMIDSGVFITYSSINAIEGAFNRNVIT